MKTAHTLQARMSHSSRFSDDPSTLYAKRICAKHETMLGCDDVRASPLRTGVLSSTLYVRMVREMVVGENGRRLRA